MSSTYIYLNKYIASTGLEYLYVGSHTWNGPLGEIDPDYFGSSSVARTNKWAPTSIEILEALPEGSTISQKSQAERKWIQKFCSIYGVADCALALFPYPSRWIRQFKTGGLMLNLHANGAEQALARAHTPESAGKSIATRKANGSFQKFLDASSKVVHNPEVYSKGLATRIANGSLQKSLDAARTVESRTKATETRRRNGTLSCSLESLNKQLKTKSIRRSSNPSFGKPKYVNVYKDGSLVTSGKLTTCCRELGNQGWDSTIGKYFNKGLVQVFHRGFLFVLQSFPSGI